jgi:hypothetical protein
MILLQAAPPHPNCFVAPAAQDVHRPRIGSSLTIRAQMTARRTRGARVGDSINYQCRQFHTLSRIWSVFALKW